MKPPHTALLFVLISGCNPIPRAASEPRDEAPITNPNPSLHQEERDLEELRASLALESVEAFDCLLATHRFTDGAIYDDGDTPKEVIAVRILLRDAQATRIFRSLVRSGSMGTRLYALCGLYFVDPVTFDTEVARLTQSDALIEYQTGCSTMVDTPVRDLLDLGADRAVRLESRDQTIRDWKAGHQERFSLGYDIIGGGFPDLFRTGGGYGNMRDLRLDQGAD